MYLLDNKYHKDSKVIDNIFIIPDIRFFTLYALLNGPLGYTEEIGDTMSEERLELIDDLNSILKKIDCNDIDRWKRYYNKNKLHTWAFIHYTSFCNLPPTFEITDTKIIPYSTTISPIMDFNTILSDFYQKCDIEKLFFQKYRNTLLSLIDRYDEKCIRGDLKKVYSYLRISDDIHSNFSIAIIPIPFDSHCVGYGSPHERLIYLFESTGASTDGLNIHEYLHFIVNPIVENFNGLENTWMAKVFYENRNREWVLTDYGVLNSFVSENFVRALDYRIAANISGKERKIFNLFNAKGLALVEPIYYGLKDYEMNQDRYPIINDFIFDFIAHHHAGI